MSQTAGAYWNVLLPAPEHSFHGVLFGWPFNGRLLQRHRILLRADLALPSTYFQYLSINSTCFSFTIFTPWFLSILIRFLFHYAPFAPWKRQVLPVWARQLSLNVFHCVLWRSASVSERNKMRWGPQPRTWMACGEKRVKDSKARHKFGNKLEISVYESPMKIMKSLYFQMIM